MQALNNFPLFIEWKKPGLGYPWVKGQRKVIFQIWFFLLKISVNIESLLIALVSRRAFNFIPSWILQNQHDSVGVEEANKNFPNVLEINWLDLSPISSTLVSNCNNWRRTALVLVLFLSFHLPIQEKFVLDESVTSDP